MALVFIAAVGVFAGISYLLVRARTATDKPVARPVVKPADPAQTAHREKAAEKAGLKRGYVSHDGKNFQVEITVHVLPRCKASDMDLIKMDLDRSKVKQLVLSIEGIGADSPFTPRAMTVSPSEVLTGFSRSFEIPQTPGAQTLGIYLCKDSANAKRCATKPLANYNRAFMEYAVKTEELAKAEAPDRLYYFQMIHLANDGDLAVFQRGLVSEDNFKALPEFLALDAAPGEKARISDDVARVKNMTRSIGSLPIQAALGITIDLPVFDSATCGLK